MEKVCWKNKVSTEEVLVKIGEKRKLIHTITDRKKRWIGNVLRREGLLKEVIEGKLEGKRPTGRPRIRMLDELKKGSYVDMKRRPEDRQVWRCWVP